ncbi:MucR family transcriptional regulator [Streptomyces sp. ATCC 21386]|uniref:MucR family transcriptional regulator n=1 Tax=Streptomyces sp. ATCC 21386 TaxID=2699428 RepID=UPI001BFF82EB|nr:MucR family transcriptional regulator [Streptomyces sp. ATCC 21386]
MPEEAGGRAPHPDFGRLLRDAATDTVACHVCGRSFRALGAHVRVHGMTADEYRQEFGLLRSRALSARSLSQEQSRARLAGYEASKKSRSYLAAGRAMARSGELNRRRWSATAERAAEPEELRRTRRATLTAGRRTQSEAAAERTAAAVRAAGFTCLEQALRTVYADRQHSVEETARILATGKNRVRQLLTEHGIPLRPTGQNSAAGRHSRVLLNDRAAATRVGAENISVWLRERSAEGVTLRELAAATGRSMPWVATRIRTDHPSD